MKTNQKKNTSEERKKKKREAEKRRRERIKADPIKNELHKAKEKERRQKRKEDKKTLSINELTPREQRIRRKGWRERAKKSRDNKRKHKVLLDRLREDTPPSDLDDRRALCIEDLRHEPASPQMSASPQRSLTVSTGLSSPTSSGASRQKLAGQKLARRNKSLKETIIEKQRQNIEELKKKLHAARVQVRRLEKINPQIITINRQKFILREQQKRRISVQKFLERDENSKLCPGKKDTITRRGKKKQKRYLCDSLDNLHKKYNRESNKPISYTTFTRCRPYWILQPKVADRDTCLCILHENFKLIVEKLRQLDILRETTEAKILSSVTCSPNSFKCMSRQCTNCSQRVPNFEEFEDQKISYKQWLTKKEKHLVKGKEKEFSHTVKDNVDTTKKELVEKFMEMLSKYMIHVFKISHQYQSITKIKYNLNPGEAILLIDFSENYQCKYASEAQSAHFGYRPQLSLHTCVLYYRDTPSAPIKVKSFCSVSDCLRHDAAGVFAHLKKSLPLLCRDFNIKIKTLHVQSDGPSSQYKNKTNFYLFTQHLVNFLGITRASWNFSESGHGKGAADGVGGTLKRTADNLVAHGQDIPDIQTFIVKMNLKTNIALYTVTEKDFTDADKLVPKSLKTIPGTKKIHQITWSRERPRTIYLRELTCRLCPLTATCSHYPIKNGRFEYANIYDADGAGSSNNFQDFNCADEDIASDADNNFTSVRATSDIEKLDQENTCPNKSSDVRSVRPTRNHEAEKTVCVDKGQSIERQLASLKEGSWIAVRFEGKKVPSHFVGQVLSIENRNEEVFVVKFLKKKNIEMGLFTWYDPEDISSVVRDDIVHILPEPTPTRRSELSFNFDFLGLNLNFK